MQLNVSKQSMRGDTLIEVMIAFALFSLVAVSSLAVMNQGTATAQRALEVTLVRSQMDAQADAIRYIHQAYVDSYQKDGTPPTPGTTAAEWKKMTAKGVGQASVFGQLGANGQCKTTLPSNAFILNARTARVWGSSPMAEPPTGGTLPPYSQVTYDTNTPANVTHAYGIWVEAVPSAGGNSDGTAYVDFHIRACWSAPGSAVPATLGTIVRLYDPR